MQTIKLDVAEIVAERLRYREALELIAERGHGPECLIAKAAMGAAGGTPLPDEWSDSDHSCRVCGEEWTEVCSDGMCEGCSDESEARAAAELKGECLIAKAAMSAAGGTPAPDEWSESGWPKCRVCGEEWTEVCSDGMCEGCSDESEARAAAELKGDAVRDEA